MTKQLFIGLLCTFFLTACAQNKNEKSQLEKNKYTSHMKKTYYANYDFSGEFEIIFNGVLMKKNIKPGVIYGLEYLNPFISKSGEQNITLIVKPINKDSQIPIADVKDYFIDIVYTNNGEPAPLNNVKKCSFPPINKPVDSLVYNWTFNSEVPYSFDGFEYSEDLTKQNQQNLLNEVVDFYKNVATIINNGNSNEYLKIFKKSREREMISMYYDEKKQKEYLTSLENRVMSSKGLIQPLENYKMFIHPNKKLVELIINGEDSALFSKDDKGKRKFYGLLLHKSSKTGKLEVY